MGKEQRGCGDENWEDSAGPALVHQPSWVLAVSRTGRADIPGSFQTATLWISCRSSPSQGPAAWQCPTSTTKKRGVPVMSDPLPFLWGLREAQVPLSRAEFLCWDEEVGRGSPVS